MRRVTGTATRQSRPHRRDGGVRPLLSGRGYIAAQVLTEQRLVKWSTRRAAPPLASRFGQQLQRRLHASSEELIGELAVCQCPGELQSANHQSEQRERVRSSRLAVRWIQEGCHAVDDA